MGRPTDSTSPSFEDIRVAGGLKSFDQFKSIVKENVLCLSMAMFLNNELAIKIYHAINEISIINMASYVGAASLEEEMNAEELERNVSIIIKVGKNRLKNT